MNKIIDEYRDRVAKFLAFPQKELAFEHLETALREYDAQGNEKDDVQRLHELRTSFETKIRDESRWNFYSGIEGKDEEKEEEEETAIRERTWKLHPNPQHVFSRERFASVLDLLRSEAFTSDLGPVKVIRRHFYTYANEDARRAVYELVRGIQRTSQFGTPTGDKSRNALPRHLQTLMFEYMYRPFRYTAFSTPDTDTDDGKAKAEAEVDRLRGAVQRGTRMENLTLMGGGGGSASSSPSYFKENASTLKKWDGDAEDDVHEQDLLKAVEALQKEIHRFQDVHDSSPSSSSISSEFVSRAYHLIDALNTYYLNGRLTRKMDRGRQVDDLIKESYQKRRSQREYAKVMERGRKKIALAGVNSAMWLGEFKRDIWVAVLFKIVRFGGQTLALNWAQQTFQGTYVKEVHARDSKDPPPLSHMLYVFLSIDATIQMLLVLLLATMYSLYKQSNTSFFVDDGLMTMLLKDSIAQSVFVLIIGEIIAYYLKKKRYFDYKMQGGATIRAYHEIMLGVCGCASLIPFNAVLRGIGL